jgi:hypothetical protein
MPDEKRVDVADVQEFNAELDCALRKVVALQEALASLPTPDDVRELTQALLTVEDVGALHEALKSLPPPADLAELADALPRAEVVEGLHKALEGLPNSSEFEELTKALPDEEEIESRRKSLERLLKVARALKKVGVKNPMSRSRRKRGKANTG